MHSTDFTKFGGKVAHGAWKNPLDFGGKLVIRIRLRLCFGKVF